jgi:phage terminase large subunit GpA-like protein
VFVNTVLGQGWREEADETNEDELASRAEPISLEAIPEAVLMLTVGCDVQQDRLEVTTAGWAKDGTCFILDHRAIWGSPDDNEIWHELDEHLNRRFDHPRGGQPLRIDAACIDAGSGSHYDVVCRFAQARLSRRVFAIKGIGGQGRPSIIRSRSKTRVLHIVGVDSLKGNILAKLAQQRAFRFSDQLPEHYWSEVTAKRRVVRYTRGRPTIRFEVVPGRESHALDALVYAHAAKAALSRLNLDEREAQLASPTPTQPQAPRVWRSKWMETGRL